MKKFTVLYEDNTVFSGDPLKGDWKKIDVTKKILKLEYIYDSVGIVLEGYRQYNHLLECFGLGKTKIARIMLMGRTFEETDVVVLDLQKNQVYKVKKQLYREYGKQILDGWQKGMMRTPKCYFKRIQPNVQ